LDAKLGGAVERIRIVRQEDVGHITPNQALRTSQKLLSLAAAVVFALVIDTDQIELCVPKSELGVFLAEQFHAGLRIEIAGFIFDARVNLVVAIAAPSAERSAQIANFLDAVGDGIPGASDEVAGDDREVRSEIVGHVHGAAYLSARHVSAQMDVAELDDLHAVQSGRQIGNGNFDAANLIVQAFGSETIHGSEERSCASSRS